MKNRLLTGASDKSDLLLHLIQNDFEDGVTVIDPDGSLARAVADIIPVKHTDHAFYFDPSDDAHIASFNVFRKVKQKDRPRLVQDLCAFFDAMFPAGETTLTRLYSGELLPTILTIIADNEDVFLRSVLKFLSDRDYQERCLRNCTNPVATDNWRASFEWPDQIRDGAIALIDATLRKLLLFPVIHRTLEKGNGFYPTKTKILVADLSRARLGDIVSKLLGTLLISRAKTPVYINEFGFFASSYLASLFSQGGYTVSLQFLSQVPPNVAQELLGFDEKFVFRTTPEDAERLKFDLGVQNIRAITDQEPGAFMPELKLDPPKVRGRSRAVLKRSIACHTRRRDTEAS